MNKSNTKLWSKDFVLAILCRSFSSAVFMMLTATIAQFVFATYSNNSALAGLCVGIFIIGALFSRIFAGAYIEIIGRKRMLSISLILFSLVALLYLLALPLVAFIALRLVHGILYGIVNNTINVVTTTVIPDERWGEGMGFFGTSVSLAAAIGPSLGIALMNQFGFQAMFIGGFCLSCIALVSGVFMSIKKVHVPEKERHASLETLKLSNLFEKRALPMSLVGFSLCVCYSSITSFVSPYTAAIDMSAWSSSFFITFSIVMLISRPFVGKRYDVLGPNRILYPAFALFTISLVVLSLFAFSPIGIVVAAIILGYSYGNISTVSQAIALKSTTQNRVGAATSTYFAISDCGLGLGPTIMGATIQPLGYSGMYLITAAIMAVTGLIYFLNNSFKKR